MLILCRVDNLVLQSAGPQKARNDQELKIGYNAAAIPAGVEQAPVLDGGFFVDTNGNTSEQRSER
jgi:hypothetical protein